MKYFVRILSALFILLTIIVGYFAYSNSIDNPQITLFSVFFIIYFQIPYLIITGILFCVFLILEKKAYKYVFEHLIICALTTFILVITLFKIIY